MTGEKAAGPLVGIRVLDLTRVWAGPLCTRILGDLGADVIRIEATWARGPRHVPDTITRGSGRYPNNEAGERPWNRDGMYNKFNRSKRSVTLQLDRPEGREILERLVSTADVLIENYTPRVMPQLGLDAAHLHELNPNLIYIGMPGYGRTGPYRDYAALGTTLEPQAGPSTLMGYRDSGPYKQGVAWADPVAALHAASAVMVALVDREADPAGQGQDIELAQLESMITFLGEEYLAAQNDGKDPPRRGNRHPYFAPQGAYPCQGEDRWIAFSITSDDEWARLCALAGLDRTWSSLRLDERIVQHDDIDRELQRWTTARDRDQLMRMLQEEGIPACVVFDAKDLVENEHLRERGFFAVIDHPDAGVYPFPGLPVRLSETPAAYRLPAPGLGEHNYDVLVGLLGLSAAEMAELERTGVIAQEPPG